LEKIANSSNQKEAILNYASTKWRKSPIRKEILIAARKSLRLVLNEGGKRNCQIDYLHKKNIKFSSHLYSNLDLNVFTVKQVLPQYAENAKRIQTAE
jgi:hypothetical protein